MRFAFLALAFVSARGMPAMAVSPSYGHSFAVQLLVRTLTEVLLSLLMNIVLLRKSVFVAVVSHNSVVASYVAFLS